MKIDKIINKIKKYDIISFDVFDTLLVRPYAHPIDLFYHMEKCLKIPAFAHARILAEQRARKNTDKSDITLDDIYNEIDDKFKELKQSELDWEYMVLRPNPDMYSVWSAARKMGKKIVIASDMYLPTEFISSVLKKNGFNNFEHIYVSCDINKTKHNGTMFDLIIRDTKVSADKILHIGDNRISDYKMPRRYGISAIQIIPMTQEYIKSDRRVSKFWTSQNGNLDASILVSIMALYNKLEKTKHDYWYQVGYTDAGPVIYGYTRWVESVAKQHKLTNLMFVARDGYTLQRVFDIFNNDIKNEYIYAPRFLNLVCRLEYRSGTSPVATAQQKTIIDYYCAKDKNLLSKYKKYDLTKHNLSDFIESNMKIFKSLANDNFQIYKSYISKNILKTKRIGIVDTITENYSAQNLIHAAVDKQADVVGLYWYARPNNKNRHFSFFDTHINIVPEYINKWNFMEFLMTSPEYPIEGISSDYKPIYKKSVSDDEKFIREIYPNISMGAVRFAEFVSGIFCGYDIYLTYDCIVRWINCFFENPNKDDFKYMRQICTTSNPNSDYYTGLFRDEIPLKYKLLHPIKYYKKIKSFMWNTVGEKIILNITHPLKLRVHGIKNIEICFLPKIKNNILKLSVKLGSNARYCVRLGSDN